jgi:hypothetical protein
LTRPSSVSIAASSSLAMQYLQWSVRDSVMANVDARPAAVQGSRQRHGTLPFAGSAVSLEAETAAC